MKFFAAAALASVALAQTSGGFSTACSKPEDTYTVESLSVGPNPVTSGQELKVNITGTLNKEITEGAVIQVTVKLGVVQVYSNKFDLCAQEAAKGNPCPIAPGPLSLSSGQALPGVAPAGSYNLALKWINADGTGITCASGPLKIAKQ